MQYTIQNIGQSLLNADDWQNTHTTVNLAGIPDDVYIAHKVGNVPKLGQMIEGSIAPDKNGRLKLTKPKPQNFNNGPVPQPQPSFQPRPQYQPPRPQNNDRVSKADPAKSDSIENQSYYKQSVELVRLHAEINPTQYDGKTVRDMNSTAVDEARWAKNQMRGHSENDKFLAETFGAPVQPTQQQTNYVPEVPPADAYIPEDAPSGAPY